MDKNTWIGFALIAAIIVGFSFLNRPSKEELAERKRVQDSIALVQAQELEAKLISEQITAQLQAEQASATPAEELAQQLAAVYGPLLQPPKVKRAL
jgi:YidC/Oxa1 family membrane protein insertase